MDSNHDKSLQRALCYRYTTGQPARKLAATRRQRKAKSPLVHRSLSNYRGFLQLCRLQLGIYSPLIKTNRKTTRMKFNALQVLLPVCLLTTTSSLFAADAPAPPSWHAQSLAEAIGYVVLFTAIGVALAIA